MTTSARDLLAQFDYLDLIDKQEVAAEILRRVSGTGELPNAGFDELGHELFLAYDSEEAASAKD